MKTEGRARRLFAGGNTPGGFHSFYDQIAFPQARRLFILKGGPGTGKSSLIRWIAQELLQRGYDLELHHCSADPQSLDGLWVPALGVAVVDGTAPHVIDPQHPGAVDEIVHLGEYWDEPGLTRQQEAIRWLSAEYRFRYARAYDALAAARRFHDEWEAYHTRALRTQPLTDLAADWVGALVPRRTGQPGRVRHLFASAITGDGPQHHLENLFDPLSRRYILAGPPGTGKATVVEKVVRAAAERGYTVEAFHCPLDPTRIEHAILRELGIGLISSAWPHTYAPRPGDVLVETGAYLDPAVLNRYEPEIREARAAFRSAFDRAVRILRGARALHDELERCYVPHMDFARVEERGQQLLERILALTGGGGEKADAANGP
ncbi:MAG: PRK06851 family protein [Firmicutes bacterium]|nr:PRK06851 family protein [Bacillota bacterium]